MKAIIIDDDLMNIELVEHFIRKYAPDVEVIGKAANLDEGIQELTHKKPDLVFLDIEINEDTGFDILQSIHLPDLLVILVTGHENYGPEASEARVIGYLLKPMSIKSFTLAVNRAREEYGKRQSAKPFKNLVHVTHKGQAIVFHYEQISRLQASKNYTIIKTIDGNEYLESNPLSYYEANLPSSLFYRVHYSHIINIKEVASIVRQKSDKILLHSGDLVPVSDRRRKEIYAHLFI